jgi:hypothetical protein
LDWGDGVVETWPWPADESAPSLRHSYAVAQDWQVSAELSGSGITAELAVHLLGCPLWPPPPPLPLWRC